MRRVSAVRRGPVPMADRMRYSRGIAQLAQKASSKAATLAAPVGGWNARDSLAAMEPLDAVYCTNFFPSTTYLQQRLGYTRFATGFPAQVETVISYSGSTTNKLLGISSGSVYDASAGGAIGAAALSGLTNSRWQYVNFTNSGGSYVAMVNGADGYYTFDGTSWVDRSASVTGVTASTLIGINLFKFRLWFVQTGTLKAWYLPTNAIQGAATEFDLSGVAQLGGFLMGMATWTVDAGYGVDDLAAFITSNGEVIVYRGTDPSSASTWALVGVWALGAPVGRRCFLKWQGDLLIVTQDGLIPMSAALQSSRTNPRVYLTDKIQSAMSQAVKNYGSNYGWEVTQFPQQNMLLMNVPVLTGANQQQYVMNTITGAWCNFTGWNANTFTLFEDELYFGGNTYIGKAWNTLSDDSAAITTYVLQAFNNFKSPVKKKRFTMMRPTFYTNAALSVLAQVNVDFDLSKATSNIALSESTAGKWGTAIWGTSKWGISNGVRASWTGVAGIGSYGAPNISTMTIGIDLKWISTDLLFEVGGLI